MRIRITDTVRVAHQALNAGVIVDLPDGIADELIANGRAEAVDGGRAGARKRKNKGGAGGGSDRPGRA